MATGLWSRSNPIRLDQSEKRTKKQTMHRVWGLKSAATSEHGLAASKFCTTLYRTVLFVPICWTKPSSKATGPDAREIRRELRPHVEWL